jgi:hypothetical protein
MIIKKFFSTKNLKKIRTEVWLILILIFALFLRLYFFVGIGFNDDSYYLEYAEEIYKGKRFIPPAGVEWGVRIAVYYPVVFFWKIFGINEFSTSLYFILLSLGSIIITYFLGKELFNEKVGLVASFLMSIFPLEIIYSTQVGPEIPTQFFSGASILFFIIAEKLRKNLYYFISGIFLGFCYLSKSVVILIIPILGFYLLLKTWKKGIFRILKNNLSSYLIFLLGFLIIFTIQLIHFYSITGEWFYGEKVRKYFFTHDLNSNPDLSYYIRMMFNLGPFFNWIHDKPYFGFFYYFVVFSLIFLLYKKDKYSLFIIFWFLFLFIFFEFGLQFFCTRIVKYCLYARHVRFLSLFSIPATLIFSRFLTFNNKIQKTIIIPSLIFLSITSLYYANQSYIFLRNGMGYIKETVYFLKDTANKTIYIPDPWTISKFKFFSQYDENFINRLKVYDCSMIDCRNYFYSSGKFIKDAFVVTELNPYTYINPHSYPEFMVNPPKEWILLKNISLNSIGIFSKFNPKIYYAP